MSFEEWMYNKSPYGNVSIREAYNAGVQSRQQEVDKLHTEIDDLKNKVFGLQKQVNKEREEATEFFTDAEYAFSKNRELQKRIDELSEINETITDELVVYRSRFGKGETNE